MTQPLFLSRFGSRLLASPTATRCYAWSDSSRRPLLAHAGTDLTIEGFPRSANSYLVVAVQEANPDLVLAHHMHTVGAIRLSVRIGVPTVVVIRHPREAILSLLRYYPDVRATHCWRAYAEYHEALFSMEGKICWVSFEQIVAGTDAVFRKIGAALGVPLRTIGSVGGNESTVFRRIDYLHMRRLGGIDPRRVARPHTKRVRDLEDERMLMGDVDLADVFKAERAFQHGRRLTGGRE